MSLHELFNSQNTTTYHEVALAFFDAGFQVIPIVPGSKKTAVKWDPWLDALSSERITRHWQEHPDHELGCILGDGVLVLDADTPEATQIIAVLEQTYGIQPLMVVKTRRGRHHYYRLAPGTFTKTDNHDTEQHPERIDVKTGRSMVVLPPSSGKDVEILEIDHVEELPEVGQPVIDAVFAHNGRNPPRPAPVPEPRDHEPLVEPDAESLLRLLQEVPPDVGYDDWVHVGMGLHHRTGGGEEGLMIWDAWSSRGEKYPGPDELRQKYRSFDDYPGAPITMATVTQLVMEYIEEQVFEEAARDPNRLRFQVVGSGSGDPELLRDKRAEDHPLKRYSLTGQSEELRRQVQEQRPLLGRLALLGQYTVLFAPPNTGKTLLVLHLLGQAIEDGRVSGADVFYINADDDYPGLVEKLSFAERFGMQMVSPGFKGFQSKQFAEHLQAIVHKRHASKTGIILDTGKKFFDTMDKRASSDFNALIREFVLQGGTCIVLAHTNKRRGADGKPIPAGTSDVLDDADCAYVLDIVADDETRQVRMVEFENIKRRGHVVGRAAYEYSRAPGLTYPQLLASVREVDDTQLEQASQANAQRRDQPVIDAIRSAMQAGTTTKMDLIKAVAEQAGCSRRDVGVVLDRYTGDDPEQHLWTFEVRERGAKCYWLIAPGQPDAA